MEGNNYIFLILQGSHTVMFQKIILTILFLCCFAFHSNAQMLGVRQGYSLWLSKYGIGQQSLKYADGQHFTWEKEIFYRQKISTKWLVESDLTYYALKNTRYEKEMPVSLRNDIIKSNVSLQYDVTYPLLGYMFYFMQGMHSYVGFNVSQNISFNKKEKQQVDGTTSTSKSTDVFMMVGFSYTHVIPVSKRLSLTSCFSFNTNSFSKYQPAAIYSRPNKSVSWMMGMGYDL